MGQSSLSRSQGCPAARPCLCARGHRPDPARCSGRRRPGRLCGRLPPACPPSAPCAFSTRGRPVARRRLRCRARARPFSPRLAGAARWTGAGTEPAVRTSAPRPGRRSPSPLRDACTVSIWAPGECRGEFWVPPLPVWGFCEVGINLCLSGW